MQRDIGNEFIVAIIAIGVLAFAVAFVIILALSGGVGQAPTPTPTILVAQIVTIPPIQATLPPPQTITATLRPTVEVPPSASPLTLNPTVISLSIGNTTQAAATTRAANDSLPPTATRVPSTNANVPATVTVATETPPKPTLTNTLRPSQTPTATALPVSPTFTKTPTSTLTATASATNTPRPTATPTATVPASRTSIPLPTRTNTAAPSRTPSPRPSVTVTSSATVTSTPTNTPSPTPSSTLTNTVTRTPTPAPTLTRTPTPTSTLRPTSAPTVTNVAALVPTASPAGAIVCVAPAGWVIYTVKSGDTLSSIARVFGTAPELLQASNCLADANNIYAGQQLLTPPHAVATSTQLTAIGCTDPNALLSNYKPGQIAKGIIKLQGTAQIPNFAYYKIETRPDNSTVYTIYNRYETPVLRGDLAEIDTTIFLPGLYWVQLTVVSQDNKIATPCAIPLIFQR